MAQLPRGERFTSWACCRTAASTAIRSISTRCSRWQRRAGRREVYVHAFLDGRDVPPQSGLGYVERLEGVLGELGTGRIATVMGRYYAMDRDNRWDRVEKAWQAITLGEGAPAASAVDAVRVVVRGRCQRRVRRPVRDRPGASSRWRRAGVLQLPSGPGPRDHPRLHRRHVRGVRAPVRPKLRFVCLTEYDPTIPAPVAYPKDLPKPRPGRRPRRAGPAPAPHRRDREVRARDVLLQRRRRDTEGRRDARLGAQSRRSPRTTSSPR